MSHVMRKPALCHMRTTKAQISLRIRTVSSAPSLAYKIGKRRVFQPLLAVQIHVSGVKIEYRNEPKFSDRQTLGLGKQFRPRSDPDAPYQIRLLLKKQSDQVLPCLPFCLYLLD